MPDEPLQRTASSSSTSSSISSISSLADHMSENSLKQFIMSQFSSHTPDGQLAATFADQFALMVRSRSSSLSDSSSSSSSSMSATSSNEMLQNPATASLMKQMLSSYQAALGQPGTGSYSHR